MDKNKRWKEFTALFLISIAVFGIAEDSHNSVLTFNEVQEQMTVADEKAELAQTDRNSEENTEQERESEDKSEQETGSEDASEQETENVVITYEELQCIFKDEKYGYVDEMGRTVIPFVYDDAASFVEGLAYFSIGEEYGFMDKTGTPVFYLDCDSVSNFQEGLAYISVDGKYGYIDQKGEIVIEPVYDDADYFQGGCAIIMKNGKFGIIDRTGKEITEQRYQNIDRGEGEFMVEENENFGVIDKTGKVIIEPKYQKIDREGGKFVVEENRKFQIIDRDGNPLLESPCEEVKQYRASILEFHDREQGIYGYTTEESTVYLEKDFKFVSFDSKRKLFVINQGERYGIVDYQGNIKIPFEYKYISYNEDYDTFDVRDIEGKYSSITADEFVGRMDNAEVEQEDARQERLPDDLRYNKLTPRVSEYLDYLQNGIFFVEDMSSSGHETSPSQWDGDEITIRLYDLGQLGKPALYLYGTLKKSAFGTPAYSGFFARQGGEVACLVSGYDGGGSAGGDRVVLWYDSEEGKLLPGRWGSCSSGGVSVTREIYDLIDEECVQKVSFRANYGYPGPEGGEYIMSYYVNGEETTEEYYEDIERRYLTVEVIR